MRTLGIDTCTRAGSVALVEAGRVVAALEAESGLDHSTRLLPAVDFLLSRLGWRAADLDGIGVTVGPGSFTGVRVGLATALGLARAAGLTATGIGSLEALAGLAAEAPEGTWTCPWLDAGRGEVYAAAFLESPSGREERLGATVIAPAQFLRLVPSRGVRFLGDGAERYRSLISERIGERCLVGSGPWFLAREVARLAQRIDRTSPERRRPAEPLYLRPSDAERARRPRP